MDTLFGVALFLIVFGPVAVMVGAELQRLGTARTRVRTAMVTASPARRVRGAARA